MENTLYIALSYQTVMERQMEVIANNIANASTAGFKGEQMMFVEYLADVVAQDDISFVEDIAVVRDYREGALTTTSNPLDVAISGKGWFVVDTPAGMRYTRNGHFTLDPAGVLSTSTGHPVVNEIGQPISVPPGTSAVVIAPDGTVSADGLAIGRLKLVGFANEQEMNKESDSLYSTESLPLPASGAKVLQGMIEESNIKPIVEITNMITALREFQSAQRLIEEENERQQQTIDTLTQSSP